MAGKQGLGPVMLPCHIAQHNGYTLTWFVYTITCVELRNNNVYTKSLYNTSQKV